MAIRRELKASIPNPLPLAILTKYNRVSIGPIVLIIKILIKNIQYHAISKIKHSGITAKTNPLTYGIKDNNGENIYSG